MTSSRLRNRKTTPILRHIFPFCPLLIKIVHPGTARIQLLGVFEQGAGYN